jgi:AcrR family transcriptional regulator
VTTSKRQSERAVTKVTGARTGGRSARVVKGVLAAALSAFAEHGYAGLSIEGVAARAGVNKTTVYRRWPTKAELLGAAFLTLRDDDPEPPDTGSLSADLLEILRLRAAQVVSPERRAIMQSLVLGSDPDLHGIVKRMREERPAIPPSVITRAIRRGELPKGSDPELIAAALLGPLHSRVYLKREPIDDAFLRALIRLVVAGAAAGGALPA